MVLKKKVKGMLEGMEMPKRKSPEMDSADMDLLSGMGEEMSDEGEGMESPEEESAEGPEHEMAEGEGPADRQLADISDERLMAEFKRRGLDMKLEEEEPAEEEMHGEAGPDMSREMSTEPGEE